MSETAVTLGLLAEIFTIVCFPIGLILLIVALIIHAIRGGWFAVEATIVGSELRWLGPDSTLYRQKFTEDEIEAVRDAEELTVYCRTYSPHRAQFERVAHDEKLLRVLGSVFVGVGIVAVMISIATALVG
jgi:hypothetical protein